MADHTARLVDFFRRQSREAQSFSAEVLAGVELADRIAANLAARRVGLTTSWPTSAAIPPAPIPEDFPACRGALETAPLQTFEPGDDAGVVDLRSAGRWDAVEIARRADELAAHPSDRASGRAARRSRAVERPILFVQPSLLSPPSPTSDALIAVLTALTLEQNASWILEPHGDALIGTITWARPTWLMLNEEGAERVCQEISGLARRERRHSRLSRVWVCAAQDPGQESLARWAESLEASVNFWSWKKAQG